MCGNSDDFADPHGKKKFVFKRGEICVYQFRRDRVADDIEMSDDCKTCVENLTSKICSSRGWRKQDLEVKRLVRLAHGFREEKKTAEVH